MTKPVALYCADLHIKRREDEKFALRQLVKAAMANQVGHFIVGGDTIDRQSNRADPISFLLREVLDPLAEAGVSFDYIQGQHDWDDPPWPSGHGNAFHAHKATFGVGPHTAYGLDFQPFGKLQEELAEVPRGVDLLFTHQGWGDWMGADKNPQGDFAQVPGHVKVVASGDLHAFKQEKHKNADGVKMLCLSPGATAMQKVNEPPEHFYFFIDDDGLFRARKLHSRIFIDWSLLNQARDLDRFMDEIEAELGTAYQTAASRDYPEGMLRPYLRVTYSHRLADTVRRVTKAVGDRAIIHWKEIPPSADPEVDKASAVPGQGEAVTPLSVLDDEVDKDEHPEVFELTSRLLQTNNCEEEFQKWWLDTLGE